MATKPKVIEPELKELMDRAAALPNLDEVLARAHWKHGDRAALIEHMRIERALWEFKQRKAADKKADKAEE